MANFDDYEPSKTIELAKTMRVYAPSGALLDATFDVHCFRSSVGRPILTRMQKELKDKVELTEEEVKENLIRDLCDLVVNWKNVSFDGKKEFKYSKENAINFFTSNIDRRWLINQITAFASDAPGNYDPKPEKS